MAPEDPRHGTVAGYVAHGRSGVERCGPCRTAAGDYERLRQARRYLYKGRLVIDGTGTRRRLKALTAIGWTLTDLDLYLGRKRSFCSWLATNEGPVLVVTAEQVWRMYEALSMTPRVGWLADRQRCLAARRGWLPPLAYDNIDDPNERPMSTNSPRRTQAELLAEFAHLTRAGESAEQAAKALGVTLGAIEKALERRAVA